MRTIRVDLTIPIPGAGMAEMFGNGGKINISTEAIVADDSDAASAGTSARKVLDEFIFSYLEDQE